MAQRNGAAGPKHARACSCDECKQQGINAWAPAAPEPDVDVDVDALTKRRREAAASPTPYCYSCGVVLPEARRGDICDGCKAKGIVPLGGTIPKMRMAMQEPPLRRLPTVAIAPAPVEADDEDEDDMPEDDEEEDEPESEAPARLAQHRHTTTHTGLKMLGQVDHTMVAVAPGSDRSHLVLMQGAWPDVTGEADPAFKSLCKYQPAVVTRMGFKPMPLILVSCVACRETMQQVGLGLKGGAASVVPPQVVARSGADVGRTVTRETDMAKAKVEQQVLPGNGKALANQQRAERAQAAADAKQVERENKVEAQGEAKYERDFEQAVRAYMQRTGETNPIKAAIAMQRIEAEFAASTAVADDDDEDEAPARKAPVKTERVPSTRQPSQPPVSPARRNEPAAPQVEPRQRASDGNEAVLIGKVQALIERTEEIVAALRVVMAERQRAVGSRPTAVPHPAPVQADDEDEDDFEDEGDDDVIEAAVRAYNSVGGGTPGNKAAAAYLRTVGAYNTEVWDQFKAAKAV